jgi:hypothetical protein
MEKTMLTPHEVATLLLVQHSPDQLHMTRAQLDTLLEHRLVRLQEMSAGQLHWQLTETGQGTVRMIRRVS